MRRYALISALALLAVATGTETVLAAGGEGSNSMFIGDVANAIWTLVVFTIVFIILAKFAWGPMTEGLQKRESFIRDSLTNAKIEREKAEQMMAEYTAKLEAAGDKAGEIVEEARRDAEETRKRLLAEAKADAEALAERTKRDIELARDDAVKRMHDDAIELATAVASKLIQKELNASDHQALIDQSLSELNRMNN